MLRGMPISTSAVPSVIALSVQSRRAACLAAGRVPQVALFYLGLLVFSQGRGRVHSLNSLIGSVARTISPDTNRGAGCRSLGCWFYKGCGGCLLLFARSPRIHSNHSARLTAVQPLFSTVRCKTLNIFIKVCYSLPCLPNTILACLLFPLLEDSSRAGNGSALSDSLPPLFSSLPTTKCSLSTLPLSPMESYRLPTPTL